MAEQLVIQSTVHMGRIEIFDLIPTNPAKPVEYLSIRLVDEDLDAKARIYAYMAPSLVGFLEDLAAQWQGWSGTKSWSSLEGELTLHATSDKLGHIHLEVLLVSGPYGRAWRLRTVVPTEAGQLDRIASDARHFFGGRTFDR